MRLCISIKTRSIASRGYIELSNLTTDLTARNIATNKLSLAGCSIAVTKSTDSESELGSNSCEYHTPPNYTSTCSNFRLISSKLSNSNTIDIQ